MTTDFSRNNLVNLNGYVGYMYNPSCGSTNSYDNCHANTNKSELMISNETWWNNNLSDSTYNSKISKEAIYCNDRSLFFGTGIGDDHTNYGSYGRIATGTRTPQYLCPQENDKFTGTNTTEIGNQKLEEKPIGFLTADEFTYAGGLYNSSSQYNYLYQNAQRGAWWLGSPSEYMGDEIFQAYVFVAYSNYESYTVVTSMSFRPVVSLKANTLVTGDDETIYVVEGESSVLVNLDAGGASNSTNYILATGTYGTLPVLSKDGYTFDGWFTATTGGTEVDSTTELVSTSTHTLYAHWTINEYTINFNDNVEDEEITIPESITKTYGTNYDISSLLAPERSGYDFLGWSATSTDTTASYVTSINSDLTTGTSAQTLYAIWTITPVSYSVNLTLDGGTAPSYSVSNLSSGSNTSFTITPNANYSINNAYISCDGGTVSINSLTIEVSDINKNINCEAYLRKNLSSNGSYTVPVNGTYYINLKGSKGSNGGRGGQVTGTKYLTAGSVVNFNIGTTTSGGSGYYPGGGSTYATYLNSTLATAAGGGGGSLSADGGNGNSAGGGSTCVVDYYGSNVCSDYGQAGTNGSGGGSSSLEYYLYRIIPESRTCESVSDRELYLKGDMCYSIMCVWDVNVYGYELPTGVMEGCCDGATHFFDLSVNTRWCGFEYSLPIVTPQQTVENPIGINPGNGGSNSNGSLSSYTSASGVNSGNGSAYIYLNSK